MLSATLNEGNANHRMDALFPGSDTQLESVTCSDPGSYCNHTDLQLGEDYAREYER